MLSRLLLGIVALSLACLASMPASEAKAQTLTVQINMYGDAQVPPVETTTWGFVRFLFDDDRSAAIYDRRCQGNPRRSQNSAPTGKAVAAGGARTGRPSPCRKTRKRDHKASAATFVVSK